jgi:hypothetical protein
MGGPSGNWHLGDIFRNVHNFANSCLRVCLTGDSTVSAVPGGLSNRFKTTTLNIGDTEEALPTTPLTDRAEIAVHNKSGTETLYIGETGVTADSVDISNTSGWEVPPGNTFNIQIANGVQLYGLYEAGQSGIVKIVEIS